MKKYVNGRQLLAWVSLYHKFVIRQPSQINIANRRDPNSRFSCLGMVTEADLENWKPSDFKLHVDHVIKHFGIDRIMFGSDWPVCKLANANLPDVYKLLNNLLEDLSEEDKRKVFMENGKSFYSLSL